MILRMHWRYLTYVLRHRWYVFLEACRLGIPWRGLTHDLSKFLPDEWFPYAEWFYGPKLLTRKELIAADHAMGLSGFTAVHRFERSREEQRYDCDLAWLKHQRRNDHHHQSWVLRLDTGDTRALPMSDGARREMLADWRGAAMAQGNHESHAVNSWYIANWDKMCLHQDTRIWIEEQLSVWSYAPGLQRG